MTEEIERAKRMVDVGMEGAEITFQMGEEPTEEEIQKVLDQLDKTGRGHTVG